MGRWMRDFHNPNPLFEQESAEKALMITSIIFKALTIIFGSIVFGACTIIPIYRLIITQQLTSIIFINYRIIFLESDTYVNIFITTVHLIGTWLSCYIYMVGTLSWVFMVFTHVFLTMKALRNRITNYNYLEDDQSHEEWIRLVTTVTVDTSE